MAAVLPRGVAALAAALLAAPPQAPESRAWERFPVFVWRQEHFGREAPAALLDPFGGTNVEGARAEPWIAARGLDLYVGHAVDREALHPERDDPQYRRSWRRWYDARDPAELVRRPCLTDPATRAALVRDLEATLAARDGRLGIGLSLGDEISLTPGGDPIDLCHSDTCRAAWARAWSELGGPGDAPAALTDGARLALAEGDTAALGPWLARRAFHRDVLADLLVDLASAVRERAPGAGVGLLGATSAGPFAGVALERVLPALDFAEAYREDASRALLLTLRRDDQRALATVFPDPAGPPGAAWQAWEHWLRGGDGLVIWSDRHLLRSPELAAELADAVAELRRLERDVPAHRPRPAGALLVQSWRSSAASWLRDALLDGPTWPRRRPGHQRDNGTRERGVDAWLVLLEDCGFLPGAAPLDALGADTARRFPLAVLDHVLVVDAVERARLEAYLDAGGWLVVRGPLAWVEGDGVPWTEDLLAALSERAPGRVHPSPAGLEDYRATRLRAGSTRAAALRATIDAWAAASGAAALRPPWRAPEGPDGVPWLVAGTREERDGVERWTCALLPNLDLPADRSAHQRARVLDGAPPEGWRLAWIQPRPVDGRPPELRPGRGAVVVLERDLER